MPNQDFEKKVQQQMQELRFRPSDESWKRIEAGIEKKKRRRPAIFWFFFLGLLTGGAIYFSLTDQSSTGITKSNSPDQVPVTHIKENKEVAASKQAPASETTIAPTDRKQTIQARKSNERAASSKHKEQPVVKKAEEQKFFLVKNKSGLLRKQYVNKEKDRRQADKSDDLAFEPAAIDKIGKDAVNAPVKPVEKKADGLVNDGDTGNQHIAANEVTDISRENSVEKKKEELLTSVQAMDSAGTKKEVGKKKRPSGKGLQWSVAVTGGISDLGRELFRSATVANFDYMLSGNVNTTTYKPSSIKAGASYSIAVTAGKNIGKNWMLNIGLSYQYFSNSISVGQKVDSTRLVNNGSLSLEKVDGFYTVAGNNQNNQYVSNQYRNKYHFISIPVSVQWQFHKRISLESGFAFSRLLGTNALHFDSFTGSYYENENLFRKNQVIASSSLLFGFSKNRFTIGPQFQYGVTSLLKTNTGTSKNLRYVGLKAGLNFRE